MRIDLSLIIDDPGNVRRTPAGDQADAAMRDSMLQVGQLQAIAVLPADPDTGQHRIVYGHRRVKAARELGWKDIEADVMATAPAGIMAIQAAENIVRAPMHPVDQWRALARIVDAGGRIESAALALGMSLHHAKRLQLLGRIHPPVLDWLAEEPAKDMPQRDILARIANTPLDEQARLWATLENQPNSRVWSLSQLCKRERIPRDRALFNIEGARAVSGLVFEEDLFAEPGTAEQWTTSDVATFMQCQRAALQQQLEPQIKRGKAKIVEWKDHDAVVPAGWVRGYQPVTDKPLKKSDPGMILHAIITEGWNVGEVAKRYVVPKPDAPSKTAAQANDNDGENAPPVGLTKKALDVIAVRKSEHLRTHLRTQVASYSDEHTAGIMLTALILALTGRNVSIGGVPHPNGHGGRFDDLLPLFFNDGGYVQQPQGIETIAAEVIARIVACHGPGIYTSSGPAADWVGAFLGVEAPRMDDAEGLKLFKGEDLTRAAALADIAVPAQVAAMRKALECKLPDWRPEAALYLAPAPRPKLSPSWDVTDDPDADDEAEAA